MSQDEIPGQDGTGSETRLMKQLAESAAEAAATKVGTKIRDEIRQEMVDFKAELIAAVREENKTYHGDMTPTEHAISHARLNKFLTWMEKMNENFWGQIVTGFVKWLFVIFLLGYFMWNAGGEQITKATGHQ